MNVSLLVKSKKLIEWKVEGFVASRSILILGEFNPVITFSLKSQVTQDAFRGYCPSSVVCNCVFWFLFYCQECKHLCRCPGTPVGVGVVCYEFVQCICVLISV